MPALRNYFQLRSGNEAVQIPSDRQRDHLILLAPHNQCGHAQLADDIVKTLATVSLVLQNTVDRVTVTALEVEFVSQVDQQIGCQSLVMEQKPKHIPQMRPRGHANVDR